MRHYFATAYRGKWVYLVMLTLMLAGSTVGAIFFAGTEYTSGARIWLDKPVLAKVLNEEDYGIPPAEQQGSMLEQLLETDSFMTAVIRGTNAATELTGNPERDRETIANMRSKLAYNVVGSNTVLIAYTGKDPVVSQQMVQSTIDQSREWFFQARLEQDSAQSEYYARQLKIYEEGMSKAQKNVDDFIKAHPSVVPGSTAALELEGLRREYDTARNLFQATETKLQQASFLDSLPDEDRQTEFRILDHPTVPIEPSTGLKTILKYLILGFGASFSVVISTIVLLTWLDTVIRTPEDLIKLSGVPVLAVIPNLEQPKGRGRWLKRKSRQQQVVRGHAIG